MQSQLPTPKVLSWPSGSLLGPLLPAWLRRPQSAALLPGWPWRRALTEKSTLSVFVSPALKPQFPPSALKETSPQAFFFPLLQESLSPNKLPVAPLLSGTPPCFLPIPPHCYPVRCPSFLLVSSHRPPCQKQGFGLYSILNVSRSLPQASVETDSSSLYTRPLWSL